MATHLGFNLEGFLLQKFTFTTRILLILALALAFTLSPQGSGHGYPEDSSVAGSWTVECADCQGYFTRMSDRSLRLDGNGRPHIAYGGDHLYYASFDGVQWLTETADPAPGVGWSASLVLDASGNPYISYIDYSNYDLKIAYKDLAGWHTQVVDNGFITQEYTSIALGADGYARIAYADHASDDLKYAVQSAGGWSIETVDSAGNVGMYASLALDSQGNPHISYHAGLSAYQLRYGYFTPMSNFLYLPLVRR